MAQQVDAKLLVNDPIFLESIFGTALEWESNYLKTFASM
jgi:hypothetical protein